MKVSTQKEVNDLEDLRKDVGSISYLLLTLILVHFGFVLGHIYDNMMLQVAYSLIGLITFYLGFILYSEKKKRGNKKWINSKKK